MLQLVQEIEYFVLYFVQILIHILYQLVLNILKFWSVAGNTLVEKKAVIGRRTDGRQSAKMQTMLSVAFGPVKTNDLIRIFRLSSFGFVLKEHRTYTGSMTGLVFIWRVNTLERTVTAHRGPIFSMFSSDNCIVTGAKEKYSSVDLDK